MLHGLNGEYHWTSVEISPRSSIFLVFIQCGPPSYVGSYVCWSKKTSNIIVIITINTTVIVVLFTILAILGAPHCMCLPQIFIASFGFRSAPGARDGTCRVGRGAVEILAPSSPRKRMDTQWIYGNFMGFHEIWWTIKGILLNYMVI